MGLSTGRDYSIFDELSEGVQVMDREWRYLYLNDAVVAQSGFPRDELLGSSFVERYPGIEATELFEALRTCMEQRRETRIANDFQFPDGSKAWFQLRVYPVPEGILIFSLDMTEETRRQLIVEHHKAELEELVAQRTAELLVRNQELMQLNYLVSHDLKSPLRTMAGFSHLLQKRLGDELDPRSREHLARIERASQRLQMMVDGILTHGRLGEHGSPEPVDTDALLDEIRADLEGPIQESGAVIDIAELPVVTAWRAELRVLFQNLVDNGLKYRREGVSPRIEIDAIREDERTWRFAVRDNGIGIPPEDQARVFNLFQRLHNRDDFPGAGLGLAHCEKIVGLHGGRIWIESTPGQGSTFLFTIREPRPDGDNGDPLPDRRAG